MELNEKIIANAKSSYLLLFISWAFLLVKHNPDINNEFVKSHTKKAIFIHILFFLNWLIFVYFWLKINFEIYNYSIDNIISIIIFIFLFYLLLTWVYKAHNKENFEIWRTIKLSKNIKFSLENNKTELNEEDKITLIMTKIPLIWFIIWAKYEENEIIENDLKLNYIITSLIFLLFILWNTNLSNLALLWYTIFVVFSSMLLFIKDEIIQLNLKTIPNLKEIRLQIITFVLYIKTYFSKKSFVKYSELSVYIKDKENSRLANDKIELEKKSHFKLTKSLIYIPILNLISIFNKDVVEKKHIILWVIISLAFILSWINFWFTNKIQIFLLFPMFAWIWHIKNNMNYEFPFLYDIYLISSKLKSKIEKIFSFIKQKKKEEKSVNLKVVN